MKFALLFLTLFLGAPSNAVLTADAPTERLASLLNLACKGLNLSHQAQRSVLSNSAGIDDATGLARFLIDLDTTLKPAGTRQLLNPPIPAGKDSGGILVAHIDSGVNYTLPHIANRLARNEAGMILDYDHRDQDTRPYDMDTARSVLFPQHHGTRVASILIAEAPRIRLAPYRYPRDNMERMADLIDQASAHGARIVAMPLGSNNETSWKTFRQAAKRNPAFLFIVSAGNNGRNIDETPVFPASLDLNNMIVVTSSTQSGKLAERSNPR